MGFEEDEGGRTSTEGGFRSKNRSRMTWVDTQHPVFSLAKLASPICRVPEGLNMHCNPITIDEFDSQRLGCSQQRS
jgi:hypothetical protein